MIVFENYKKEKPKNIYGRFFLAEEAPGDEGEEEYTPPRPRNAKIITVKPNNRRTLDFSAGAEDLMNDPNIDNINFDLGDGADPETDELPDVNNLFNNPAINGPLNIPNDDVAQTDNMDQPQDVETPPEDITNVTEPPVTDDINNPVDQPTETPPEETTPPVEEPPVDTTDVNTDINNPDVTPTEPATDVNMDVPQEPAPEPDMTADVNTPPAEEPVPDVGTPDATATDVTPPPAEDVTQPAPEAPPTDQPDVNNPTPDATEPTTPPDATTPDATNPAPDQNQVITPDSGGGDDMGDMDFSAGGEGGDDMGLGADAGAAGGDATTGTDQNQQSGVGVGLDTMRKYSLFNEFINFGNAITNYIEKLENLVLDDPGQNQVIKYVIKTLHSIKDMIYDYINMKFELSTYFASRTFFDEMYVATQVTIGMLSKLNEIKEDDDKKNKK